MGLFFKAALKHLATSQPLSCFSSPSLSGVDLWPPFESLQQVNSSGIHMVLPRQRSSTHLGFLHLLPQAQSWGALLDFSALWTCKTCIATVNQNSNDTLAKHTELLLGGWEVKTGGVWCFSTLGKCWVCAVLAMQLPLGEMWPVAIPSVLSSLFVGREVALQQQNVKAFPGKQSCGNEVYSNWSSEICFKLKFQSKIHLPAAITALPIIPYDITPLHPKTLSQSSHIHLHGLHSSEEVRNLGIRRKLSFENTFSSHILSRGFFPALHVNFYLIL